ncbi:hypothetical protein BJ508DRAFT_414314, partial [Ascobolus immersus RN42]
MSLPAIGDPTLLDSIRIPTAEEISSDPLSQRFDNYLYGLYRQCIAITGSENYVGAHHHRELLIRAFGYISPPSSGSITESDGPMALYKMLDKMYNLSRGVDHNEELLQAVEKALRFCHTRLEPSLLALAKLQYSSKGAADACIRLRPGTVLEDSENDFSKTLDMGEYPHRLLITEAIQGFRSALVLLLDSPFNCRHRSGLLRAGQVQLIKTALERQLIRLAVLCDLCGPLSDGSKYCLGDRWRKVNEVSAEILTVTDSTYNLIAYFLANRNFRSERLELLLLRYVAEDGGDAGTGVELRLGRIHATHSMIFVYRYTWEGDDFVDAPPISQFCKLLRPQLFTAEYHKELKDESAEFDPNEDLVHSRACSPGM